MSTFLNWFVGLTTLALVVVCLRIIGLRAPNVLPFGTVVGLIMQAIILTFAGTYLWATGKIKL